MKMIKANKYYQIMRLEVKRLYEFQGNMDWTITMFWGEDETRRTMQDVVKIAQSKLGFIKRDVEFGIYGEEKAEYERMINSKIVELANVRIEILS